MFSAALATCPTCGDEDQEVEANSSRHICSVCGSPALVAWDCEQDTERGYICSCELLEVI